MSQAPSGQKFPSRHGGVGFADHRDHREDDALPAGGGGVGGRRSGVPNDGSGLGGGGQRRADSDRKTADVAARFVRGGSGIANEVARDDVLRERVRIHLRSTGSHAKLIIADDGEGGITAVVGSCNWLYTGYDRFELSLRLREPGLVADVMDRFSALVAKPGFKPEIGAEMFITARKMRERDVVGGSHQARIITGVAHEAILREASGAPAGRFVVASDKLGNSAFPNAIIPAEVAAAAVKASPVVIYGDATGKISGKDASEMTHDVRERGVRLLASPKDFTRSSCFGATTMRSSQASTGAPGPRMPMPQTARSACT